MKSFIEHFDPDFYRAVNPDIKNFSNEDALNHFVKYGITEGRICSKLSYRKEFIECLHFDNNSKVLEVGPFNNPIFTGNNVKYFDVLNSDDLRARSKNFGLDTSRTPDVIHFVDPYGDLSTVNEKFDLVISSHVIEHQPDLISFLINIKNLLNIGGIAAFIVPDKRYCFDHYNSTSNIFEVLSSHISKDKKHSLYKFFLHRLNTVHNNPVRHFQKDHGKLKLNKENLLEAINEWNKNKSNYIDVHSWFFTPLSLIQIFQSLKDLDYLNYSTINVFNTPKNQLEFCFYFS